MVACSNFSKTCARCLAWTAAERAMLCTTNIFHLNYVQMLWRWHLTTHKMGKYSAYFLTLFLCWCDASSWCVVQCHTFCHGRQKSLKKQALHLTCWALCIDCTMHRNFSGDIFFLESLVCSFFDEIYHLGARFQLFSSAWRFELIENGSRLARKWRTRGGTEANATTGQLV